MSVNVEFKTNTHNKVISYFNISVCVDWNNLFLLDNLCVYNYSVCNYRKKQRRQQILTKSTAFLLNHFETGSNPNIVTHKFLKNCYISDNVFSKFMLYRIPTLSRIAKSFSSLEDSHVWSHGIKNLFPTHLTSYFLQLYN